MFREIGQIVERSYMLNWKLVNINTHKIVLPWKLIWKKKLNINKYRLTTNNDLVQDKQVLSILEINNLLNELYLSESPYLEKHGVRYYRNTDKFVSEGVRITVLNSSDNSSKSYNSLTECAESLNISRKKIKELLNSGVSYKGYTFVLN